MLTVAPPRHIFSSSISSFSKCSSMKTLMIGYVYWLRLLLTFPCPSSPMLWTLVLPIFCADFADFDFRVDEVVVEKVVDVVDVVVPSLHISPRSNFGGIRIVSSAWIVPAPVSTSILNGSSTVELLIKRTGSSKLTEIDSPGEFWYMHLWDSNIQKSVCWEFTYSHMILQNISKCISIVHYTLQYFRWNFGKCLVGWCKKSYKLLLLFL